MPRKIRAKTEFKFYELFLMTIILGTLSLPAIYYLYTNYPFTVAATESILIRNSFVQENSQGVAFSDTIDPIEEEIDIETNSSSYENFNENIYTKRLNSSYEYRPLVTMSLQGAQEEFKNHVSHLAPKSISLERYMLILSKSPKCIDKPVFMTMARVSSDLYWQLIENFFYTMYIFGHLDCAVMVCVSGI